MKKRKESHLHHRPSLAKRALLVIAPIALANSAFGVVTVTFTESGSNVIVSFSGTLAVDPQLATDVTLSSEHSAGGYVGSTRMGPRQATDYYANNLGSAIKSGIVNVLRNAVVPGDAGTFGFASRTLYWAPGDISGGSVGAVSEFTVSPATASFTLPGRSLASLNADGIAAGTVLWRATNTNDTFIFIPEAAAPPVPEPSSLLLCGLGAAGLLLRRRR